MPAAHVKSRVRLKEDIPELFLKEGAKGVVTSVWLSRGDFGYEVEFEKTGESPAKRILLRAEQIEILESDPS